MAYYHETGINKAQGITGYLFSILLASNSIGWNYETNKSSTNSGEYECGDTLG